ncbi:hypothetical protein COCC4DRAFT_205442 [Bipolaris maydis ATCC 48331]|uniref:Uncharacterized protein n=2 Tax=Cochliobolus heterostrophus TaxID=5016 RepID=M2TPC3_COCH5|nr:uncharacterized protein COCC4DRAFT_205442 [Bipolaris maydis ATCC 48331]EMD88384.1 hypothetical protein COCHEDRAFT_1158363 [Bipolaris maydis C5]ENI00776.1 hypothetical protein COCC4DRAFT_205442 [Bipolaris maydis ATCC 48331]KAJ6205990.1 hypothetical protein PSV09DRAFT_1158363 [Bipolaris maydis]
MSGCLVFPLLDFLLCCIAVLCTGMFCTVAVRMGGACVLHNEEDWKRDLEKGYHEGDMGQAGKLLLYGVIRIRIFINCKLFF